MPATQYSFRTIQVSNQTQESTLGEGSLAGIYRSSNSALLNIDVVGQYAWTLSPPLDSQTCSTVDSPRTVAPVIELREFEVNESTISRQLQFYFDAAFTSSRDYLAAYDDLFPKDQSTNLLYRLPYFSDVQFEVSSPPWQSLDTAEQLYEGGKNIVSKGVGYFFGAGAGATTEKLIDYAETATKAAMALSYPKVGIMDRPKLWTNHDFRTINVSFPLFNTHNFSDTTPEWKKNRELCFLLTYQNLFNKRSFITGIPPVFYEVLIPGQHFSIASCITNITVNNRGNMRLMYDSDNQTSVNVPDVYEVNLTLTDMVMPSKNQLQAAYNEQVRSACREASE
jgi:hypothetical protein